jgi:hypothetical protein
MTSKSQSSLPQVGCVRGANTFPNHNQSLTRESLTRPVHPGFLVTLNQILGGDSQQINQQTMKDRQPTPRNLSEFFYKLDKIQTKGIKV